MSYGKMKYLLGDLPVRGSWKSDKVGMYSMTPVMLAQWIFRKLGVGHTDTVLETCAGVGADTAVLCNLGARVMTYEPDRTRFRMLRDNLRISTTSGMQKHMISLNNEECDISWSSEANVVYLDVPWGGEDYKDAKVIEKMYLGDLELGDVAKAILDDRRNDVKIVYKLPPQYDWRKLQDTCLRAGAGEDFNIQTEYITPPPGPVRRDGSRKIPNIRWFVATFSR